MKKLLVAMSIMAAMLFNVQATLIDFTSAEGYSDGALNGQPASAPTWTATSDYQITNSTGSGSVSINGATSYKVATLGTSLSSSETSYTYSLVFSFSRDAVSGTGTFLAQQFSAGGGHLDAILNRYNATSYQLAFSSSVAGQYQNLTLGEGLFGLNGTTVTNSDPMKLTFTLNRGASETDWSYTAVLENLTTSTTKTLSGTGRASSSAFYSGALNLVINNQGGAATAGVSNLSVSSLEYAVIPEPATVGLFSISSIGLLFFRHLIGVR